MASPPGVVIGDPQGRARETFEDPARGDAAWVTLFSSDRTPTRAMSAGMMEIAPGGALEPHRHAQAEIYFVAQGEGLLTVEGIATRIAEGQAAFIPGDAEHSLRNDTCAPLSIFYVFPTDSFADIVYRFSPPRD